MAKLECLNKYLISTLARAHTHTHTTTLRDHLHDAHIFRCIHTSILRHTYDIQHYSVWIMWAEGISKINGSFSALKQMEVTFSVECFLWQWVWVVPSANMPLWYLWHGHIYLNGVLKSSNHFVRMLGSTTEIIRSDIKRQMKKSTQAPDWRSFCYCNYLLLLFSSPTTTTSVSISISNM